MSALGQRAIAIGAATLVLDAALADPTSSRPRSPAGRPDETRFLPGASAWRWWWCSSPSPPAARAAGRRRPVDRCGRMSSTAPRASPRIPRPGGTTWAPTGATTSSSTTPPGPKTFARRRRAPRHRRPQGAYDGSAYTSGRINTWGFFAQAQGRFEARIRLPRGRGLWPASGSWERLRDRRLAGCGEIDIMDIAGRSRRRPREPPRPRLLRRERDHRPLPWRRRFDAGFHVFAVQWERDRITWYVDDISTRWRPPRTFPPRDDWVSTTPSSSSSSRGGGNFVGPPDASTVFPQTMLVDWVRVYRSASERRGEYPG